MALWRPYRAPAGIITEKGPPMGAR